MPKVVKHSVFTYAYMQTCKLKQELVLTTVNLVKSTTAFTLYATYLRIVAYVCVILCVKLYWSVQFLSNIINGQTLGNLCPYSKGHCSLPSTGARKRTHSTAFV